MSVCLDYIKTLLRVICAISNLSLRKIIVLIMKACWSLCTLKRWKFWYGSRTIFKLFALEFCTNSLHDRNPSIISGFLIRSWLGRYVNIVVKYLYGSSPFAFAVSIMLYAFALDCAPDTLLENNQFFLPFEN